MKNLKDIMKVLLLIVVFSISPNLIEADPQVGTYNGEGKSGPSATGQACNFNTGTEYCTYKNAEHQTVKAILYYFDSGRNRNVIAGPIFLTNNKDVVIKLIGDIPNIIQKDGLTWETAKNWFITYNPDGSVNQSDSLEKLKGLFGETTMNSLNQPSDKAPGEKGYRVIIEPALTVYNNSNGNRYFLRTVKEIASNIDGLRNITCHSRWNGKVSTCNQNIVNGVTRIPDKFSTALNTEFTDVGILQMKDATDNIDDIANPNLSYGYNIVDVTDVIKKCYTINIDSKPATCKNGVKRNEGSFEETGTTEVTCNSGNVVEDATEYGRKIEATINKKKCTYYCLEKVYQYFPGNYATRVNVGGNLVWPTGASTKELYYNQYQLSFKGKLTCYSPDENAEECTNFKEKDKKTIAQKIYNFNSNITVKYQNGSKNKKGKLQEITVPSNNLTSTKNYSISTEKKHGKNYVTVSVTQHYHLNDYNRYVVIDKKGKLKIKPSKPTNLKKLKEDKGYGNLAVSSSAEANKKYDLRIITNSLGIAGQFTRAAKDAEYKCYYETQEDIPDHCTCPVGTKNEGRILDYCKTNNEYNEKESKCLQLQSEYCDENIITVAEETSYVCPPEATCYTCPSNTTNAGVEVLKEYDDACNDDSISSNKLCHPVHDDGDYCPAPNKHISIASCTNMGISREDCQAKLCNNVCKPSDSTNSCLCNSGKCLKCPNTNSSNASDMDANLVACVETKVAQGVDYSTAVSTCEKLVCPLQGLGFIYRVIDLDNPFPGKEISNIVVGFNDNVKGRYPGTNWNSKTMVYKKIRNNRSTDGDKIYTSTTPLYTFTLTPQIIKSIREYNQRTTYDDFNLVCKNNSSACISQNFVHSGKYGLTSGKCSNVSVSDFYTCNIRR